MRILQLTPGTGNFYCGSCLRDNALVRGLRARGHEVLMVPLYLPLVTDEPAESAGTPIFLSGLSVYLGRKFSVPGWLDRVLSAPALLRVAAQLAGLTSAKDLGESAVAMLQGGHGEEQRLIAWLRDQPAPDVICLSNSLLSGLAGRLKNAFHVPVVSSFQGEDAFLDGLPEPYRQQAWRLLAERCADIDHFLAISRHHGEQMAARLGLDPCRVTVAYPGISVEHFAPATAPPAAPTIGYLARMHPGKGLGLLIDAFILLKKGNRIPGLRLRVAGSKTAADRRYVAALHWLADTVEFLPNLDPAAKAAFLRSLTVFSVPADTGEAFGHYVLEALASGVPVVEPRHAAFPELLAQTGGGLLCDPENAQSLADALAELLLAPARARQLGAQGRQAVGEKFTIETMTATVENILQRHASRTS